jgi:hypothetical protein
MAHEAILLADGRFILEPDFDRRALGHGGQMDRSGSPRSFFKRLDDARVLTGMARRALT